MLYRLASEVTVDDVYSSVGFIEGILSLGFILKLFLDIIFDLIGRWHLFKKFGEKGWKALIPFYNDYRLSVFADREPDGRVLMFADISAELLSYIAPLFIREDTNRLVSIIVNAVSMVLVIISMVYTIRVCLGLCQVFGRSKKWVIGWVFFNSVCLMIWGLSKKFVPAPKEEVIVKAAEESGLEAKEDDNCLSINLRERSAVDFFKKKTLLRDVHLNIPKGHMVLLLGGSGAGKTTFLNAVTGYEQADADILMNGGNVYKDYESMKYDIGFVPQGDLMRGNDTVGMTVADAALLRVPSSVSTAERKKKVGEVLDIFGLSPVSTSLVDKLSGGQRKRLSIAMEYISDPTLFILDEPDSGLDGVVARGLFEKLRLIADKGKIVIVITHTPDRVIDLFDDVIVLAKDAERTGRLAFYGSVQDGLDFFGKTSMEGILVSINREEEGGEGRADEFVEKYAVYAKERMGGPAA
ncbi:MAG: ABC transporter ATP-binding protein [Oscillospiraceae bacterium]|nr:ABC transporter ATP-binding protein [Oscillospiraceae bacterium]